MSSYFPNKFIKRSVIDGITSQHALAQLDVHKKENIVSLPEQVEVGYVTKQALDMAKQEKSSQDGVSQRQQLFEFFHGCIAFIRGIAEKIQEQSPLKYPFVRALQAIVFDSQPGQSYRKSWDFTTEINYFNSKWVIADQCDIVS